MEQELRVRVLVLEGSVLVQVEGEIDRLTTRKFEDGLAEAIRMAGAEVEVDLTETTFFGSEGLNALVRAYRDASRRSLDLRVTAASPLVRRVLEVTGTDRVLGMADPHPDPN